MFQEYNQIIPSNLGESGITCTEFDPQEELLWSGSTSGVVKSYYGVSTETHSSFRYHEDSICQVLPLPTAILTLSQSVLHCSKKGGFPLFSLRNKDHLTDMYRMAMVAQNVALVGMVTGKMAAIDISTSQVLSYTAASEGRGVVGMKWSGSCVVVGDTSGKVQIVDPMSLQSVHSVQAHSGSVTELELCGNYIVTCGCVVDRFDQPSTDPQLMVFDQRMLKPSAPLQNLSVEPHLLRALPLDPSHLLVGSQVGMFQIVDISGLMTPDGMVLHQIPPYDDDTSPPTPPCLFSAAASPSGQFVAFGDGFGVVHVWVGAGQEEGECFNLYSQPSEFPDPPDPTPFIDFESPLQGAPLSSVPVYRFSEAGFASDYWPVNKAKFIRRRLAPIPPQIMGEMKMQEFVGYAPKPAELKRNQIPYVQYRNKSSDDFLLEPESPMMRSTSPFFGIPKMYQKTEIKYSKLGVEEFDFRHYNSTKFAGLEIHIPNAYCNSMIQALYFLLPLRFSLLQHSCVREFCLSCELNFLYGMMQATQQDTCQASNFLRAFRTLREALTLGLLLNEEEEDKADLAKLIQKWITFVLQQLHMEMQSSNKSPSNTDSAPSPAPSQPSSVVEELFASRVQKVTACRCGTEQVQETMEMVFPLQYPCPLSEQHDKMAAKEPVDPVPGSWAGKREGEREPTSPSLDSLVPFSSVVAASICCEQSTHAWCAQCNKFKGVIQKCRLLSLPQVLSLNTAVEGQREREFWRNQQKLTRANFRTSWLPHELKMSLSPDHTLTVSDSLKGLSHGSTDEPGVLEEATFELRAAICHVKGIEGRGNLVGHILASQGGEDPQWFLFNDFVIHPIPKNQAAVFEVDWLLPCVVFYARKSLDLSFSGQGLQDQRQLDPSVLLAEMARSTLVPQSPLHFTSLRFHDMPSRGDLVGIDAEFVTLNQEEAEVRTDGTQTTIKPSQLSVARISCVRGWGLLEGTAFTDDYIRTHEQVVDYLTKFSGIKPGDLDASVSSKHLSTLKATYSKLLCLVQLGVVFVGHGLKKDFRVINIKIPSGQVMDTVELFRLSGQRYISLKFLSWYILQLKVQEGCHDSIEDAHTALLLFRKYQELKRSSQLEETLLGLYEAGRELQWKVPQSS